MVGAQEDHELIWFRPERLRRGPRPTLSREEITQAAIDLADSEGLDAVSMRRIAAKLSAGATSLYWHVSSKEDLYELMVDAVIGEIRVPKPSGKWLADLEAIARATYATLRKHRWLVLVGIQPGLGPQTQEFGASALRVFDGLNFDLATQINVLAAVNNYLFGFLHRELAWERQRQRSGLSEEQWRARLGTYLQSASGEDHDLAEHMAQRFGLVSEESFELGLGCLLRGVAQLAAPRGRAHR